MNGSEQSCSFISCHWSKLLEEHLVLEGLPAPGSGAKQLDPLMPAAWPPPEGWRRGGAGRRAHPAASGPAGLGAEEQAGGPGKVGAGVLMEGSREKPLVYTAHRGPGGAGGWDSAEESGQRTAPRDTGGEEGGRGELGGGVTGSPGSRAQQSSVSWGREGGRQEGQAGPLLAPQTLRRDNSVTRAPLQGKASGHPRPPANRGPHAGSLLAAGDTHRASRLPAGGPALQRGFGARRPRGGGSPSRQGCVYSVCRQKKGKFDPMRLPSGGL